ncbi:SUN domain-containing protein 2-like [Eurytemora carolleeae]|uniref:SUN domain-containing protein 2-like n=1 Tax=Eurytemora carolleeae TaxID=1294199 RepID=UPI000C77EC36|nr:SUN domain-containing protein 2-like [Eurytemora carolleeae]|eukprot:XP_023323117.1 SUN domain-containing protein 2-like [Eurytemora affinis]
MAGDEEDGGGELRKLNKENEHEKKEVGGLNVSIEQNEYSKVALKNMLEIRKARISEISSQDCRELTGRSRFQILQKLKALHLENKQKPPLEPNGEVPEMKRKQNERITDNITLIQKEPVSKSLKPGNREKILDILRKSKQAQALQQEQKQEQKQEQEQEPQQQEQHQQQQHQQKQQQQQQQQHSKKSSSFASDGKDENLSVSQTSELLENARTNILRRISFTANKKTNTAG